MTRKEADARRAEIVAALKENGGNVTRAAEALGCTRATMYNHAAKLGLQREFGLRDPDDEQEARRPVAAAGTRRTVTVGLEEGLWRWVRIAAINRRTTASAIVEHALERLRVAEEPALEREAPIVAARSK